MLRLSQNSLTPKNRLQMSTIPEPIPSPVQPKSHVSRRAFFTGALLSAGALVASRAGALAETVPAPMEKPKPKFPQRPDEWRNRHPDMAYRRLGRTGFMISELVMGGSGDHNRPEGIEFFDTALDRGVNYLDTASGYNRGESELAVGKLVARPGVRDRVFISTKITPFVSTLDRISGQILEKLPESQRTALRAEAMAELEAEQIAKPGTFFTFFGGQLETLQTGVVTRKVRREFADRDIWHQELRRVMIETVETSLQRLRTDVIDILHCPHAARFSEELNEPVIDEVFAELRKAGKVRFRALSTHTNQARVLDDLVAGGKYDAAMIAYNVGNHGFLDEPIRRAHAAGVGIIAMKGAAIVNPMNERMKPVPQWRIDKLNQQIPGNLPLPVKGYLWVLQNPHISAVISEVESSAMIKENLAVVGKRVALPLA